MNIGRHGYPIGVAGEYSFPPEAFYWQLASSDRIAWVNALEQQYWWMSFLDDATFSTLCSMLERCTKRDDFVEVLERYLKLTPRQKEDLIRITMPPNAELCGSPERSVGESERI